jgi:hypothetical protein
LAIVSKMTAPDSARPIIPTFNRIDRATKRAARERLRKERESGRRPRAELSLEAPARSDALIEQLTRVHCAPYNRLDWHEIAGRTLVEPAMRANAKELVARRNLAAYRPGVIDSMFGLEAEKRRKLTERVLEAAKADAILYAKAKRNAEVHNLDINLAGAVLALDPPSIDTAIRAHMPVDELTPVLEGFGAFFPSPKRLVVLIDALERDALPDEMCELLESGKIGYMPTPYAQLNELHIANVCSAALRVGMEILATVPLDSIEVISRCFLPNPQTRDFDQHPIVYVKMTHEALSRMDLRRLEPVSTITALGGRIDWDNTRGFAPIRIDDLKLAPQARPVLATRDAA